MSKPSQKFQSRTSPTSVKGQTSKHPAAIGQVAAVQKKQLVAPQVYRPQPTPKVLQRKKAAVDQHSPSAISGPKTVSLQQSHNQSRRLPTEPPVYRPQPTPKCLQLKATAKAQVSPGKDRRTLIAAPLGRPQLTPKVLQTKKPNGAGTALSRASATPNSRFRPTSGKVRSSVLQMAKTVQVSHLVSQRLAAAAQAINYVKQVLPHGAGNISESIAASEGKSTYAADAGRKFLDNRGIRTEMKDKTAEEKIYYRAGAAIQAHGGFCKEHADVTFWYLMSHTNGLPITYCVSDRDHAFVIIGNTETESPDQWVVADPWPVRPQACRWNDFFMKGEFSVESRKITDGQDRSAYKSKFAEIKSHTAVGRDQAKFIIESAGARVWKGNIKTVGLGTAEAQDIAYGTP